MRLAVIRRLVTLAAVASLGLCVATVALWVRSYWYGDRAAYCEAWVRPWTARDYECSSDSGYLRFDIATYPTPLVSSGRFHHFHYRANRMGKAHAHVHTFRSQYGTTTWVEFPHWFLALVFAVLPALRLRAAICSRRRGRAG